MSSKEELYKLLLEASPFGTLFFAYGVCVDCNPLAQQLLGCDKRTLLGTSLDEIEPGEPVALVSLKQALTAALEGKQSRIPWQCDCGDGEQDILIDIRTPASTGSNLVVTLMPRELAPAMPAVSEPAPEIRPAAKPAAKASAKPGATVIRAEKPAPKPAQPVVRRSAFEHDVYIDVLTELPNRQFLLEAIREHLASPVDSGAVSALLMVDFDHFKDINDSWGHPVGDQVIRKLGIAMSRLVSEKSILARLAGDEFMLFLPDLAENASEAAVNAKEMAEKIKEVITHPIFYEGHEFILTASVGIALLNEPELTAERALQFADSAMYEAKRKGRNGIAFFDQGISEKAQRQVDLNTRLRKAVDNQEFALYIQPQISIASGELVGGEALLRWVNADRITNMPSEFVPLLEASGLIVNVGQWVIRTACEYIRSFIDAGLWKEHMRLGVNISPRQFNDPQLLEVIEHSLKSYDIKPKYLNFEVTENLVIEDVEDAIRKMQAIKALGSMFSIDDFGLGYSSMIYLKRLPFDQLKIDREFIRNIHGDSETRGVVEAIMAVSRQYGLSVTAEGVEDDNCLTVLREVGCDQYQGAYYSMPVPVEHFRKMLAA